MAKIALVTDGSCDIPKDLVEKYNIHIIPFRVVFGEEIIKTFGDWGTLTKDEFYEKVRTCEEYPTSAIPSPAEIDTVFSEAQKNSDSVIGIFLSNSFSGLFSAVKMVVEKYENADITLVDSQVATSTLGVIVMAAAKMIEKGSTKKEIIQRIEEIKKQARMIVILDSVDSVYRSGRVGWAKKFMVSSLQIKPIVTFKDGLIVSSGTLQGSKEVVKRMKFIAPLIIRNSITENIFIWHVRRPKTAQDLLDIMEEHNEQKKEIRVIEAGPVVGTHVGEKSLGFMWIGDYKKQWIKKMKE
jgi:DegV family protein with EDD domain